MLEDLQTHRQILFDLTANYLEPLNGSFARLAYVAGLHDSSTGTYIHDRLASVYGAERVDQVVAYCHSEVFERLLEMPLAAQEEDLRLCIQSLPGSFAENAKLCRANAKRWIPADSPGYLTALYSSNLHALLELLRDNTTTAR